jgi:hypothetical protein
VYPDTYLPAEYELVQLYEYGCSVQLYVHLYTCTARVHSCILVRPYLAYLGTAATPDDRSVHAGGFGPGTRAITKLQAPKTFEKNVY